MQYQISPTASDQHARVWTYSVQDRSPRAMCADVDAMQMRKALREVPDATAEVLGHRHTPTGRHSITIRRARIQPDETCGPNCYVATAQMQYEKGLITTQELAAGQPPTIIHKGACATLQAMARAIQPDPVKIVVLWPAMEAHLGGCADIKRARQQGRTHQGESVESASTYRGTTVGAALLAADTDMADAFGEEPYQPDATAWSIPACHQAPCMKAIARQIDHYYSQFTVADGHHLLPAGSTISTEDASAPAPTNPARVPGTEARRARREATGSVFGVTIPTSDTTGDTTMTAKTATSTRKSTRRTSTRAAAKPAAATSTAAPAAPKTVPAGQHGLHADGTYTCFGCGATHPRTIEYFNADKTAKDGLWSRCRACGRAYANAYEAKRRAASGRPAAQPRGGDSAKAKALAAAAAAVPDAALNDQAFVESDAGQAALALKAEAAKAARRAADRDRKRAARAAAKEAAAN